MANKGPNTNGSQVRCTLPLPLPRPTFAPTRDQFFLMYGRHPHLNNVHSVFGKVIHGLEVLDIMERVPTDAKNRPVDPIVIKRVTIHANPLADDVLER